MPDPKNPNPNGPNQTYSTEDQALYNRVFRKMTKEKSLQPGAEARVNEYENARHDDAEEHRHRTVQGESVDYILERHPNTTAFAAAADAIRDAGIFNAKAELLKTQSPQLKSIGNTLSPTFTPVAGTLSGAVDADHNSIELKPIGNTLKPTFQNLGDSLLK